MISAISGRSALVVDDDPLLVRLSCRALQAFGFRTIDSANSGETALNLVRTGARQYDVLLCDLAMPTMDGVEVLHHLAELGFKGGIIIVSGQDDRVIQSVAGIANANRLNILGWLQKPFAIEALRELLIRIDSPTGLPAPSCPPDTYEADFSLTDLTRAIYNREIDVHFQPKLDLTTGEITSVEALARWQLPDGTAISPGRFVPVAEQYELSRPLTDLVLEKALGQCRHWCDQGFDVNVAVNIPAFTLADPALPRSIQQATAKAGVAPDRLTLEITETQLLREPLTSLETLNRLRLLGVRLSIDDFGTGYSSLKQLQLIPFQELKIDRDFVQRALEDSVSRAIVESSVQLARSAGLTVVAEGVETPDQLELMQQLSCDYVQGYLIARPMPGDVLLRWLSSRHAESSTHTNCVPVASDADGQPLDLT